MNIMNYCTRDVIAVAPSDSLDKAISLMEEHHIHHLIARSDDRVVGVVSDRDLLLSVGWLLAADRRAPGKRGHIVGPTVVEQVMSRNVVCLDNSDTARHAATLFAERKIGVLPILHLNRLVGVLTESDLLFWLDKLAVPGSGAARLLGQPVESLMRAHVLSVEPTTPIGDVIDHFRRRHIRHVPVVLGEELVGIISDRDVRRALGVATVRDMQAQETGEYYVGPRMAQEIMSPAVRTLPLGRSLRDALSAMLDNRVHSLPLVSGGRLVGIITQTDFVKALARDSML